LIQSLPNVTCSCSAYLKPCGERTASACCSTDASRSGDRRQIVKHAMRSSRVVITSPFLALDASLVERREQRLVREYVAQSIVEALDQGVCCGSPGRCSANRGEGSAPQRSIAGEAIELGAAVRDALPGQYPPGNQCLKSTDHRTIRQRRVGHQAQALPRVVVTTVRMRNCRPSLSASCRKSIDQCGFGRWTVSIR
jgi:hypothetical protein